MLRNPRRTAVLSAVATALLAVAISGCGIGDPYQAPTDSPTATGPVIIDNEVRSRGRDPGPDRPRAAPAATASGAVERFARLYINWTYRTLASHRRQLASMAVGEAAATERRAAVETARDYVLRQGKIENQGQILALAPVRGRAHQWVVVTRETTSGEGTYEGLPAAHHVTLATVEPVDGGWAVSQWQPRS